MRTISDTITRLSAYRDMADAGLHGFSAKGDNLSDLSNFGPNPGALRARCFVPDGLPAKAPLMVVLHGCTQSAAGYDQGSGWSQLAETSGFALLFPEQSRSNNANLCFNWFEPGDTRRGHGEALSIRQMVAAMVAAHDLDPHRVFITGLSAGGAMASVLLAAYPDVFAGGAIIAGVVSGSATTMPEAFDRMRGHGAPNATELARQMNAAAPHQRHWPVVSVWTGDADRTVDASNAALIAETWRTIHGLADTQPMRDSVDGCSRQRWVGSDGMTRVELITVPGMAHGTPVDPADVGAAMPFMLSTGISSSRHIAERFGLVPTGGHGAKRREPKGPAMSRAKAQVTVSIAETIDNALHAAGLR